MTLRSTAARAASVGVGLVAGYRGGAVAAVLMRVTEVFMAFPRLIVALVAVLRPGSRERPLSPDETLGADRLFAAELGRGYALVPVAHERGFFIRPPTPSIPRGRR